MDETEPFPQVPFLQPTPSPPQLLLSWVGKHTEVAWTLLNPPNVENGRQKVQFPLSDSKLNGVPTTN